MQKVIPVQPNQPGEALPSEETANQPEKNIPPNQINPIRNKKFLAVIAGLLLVPLAITIVWLTLEPKISPKNHINPYIRMLNNQEIKVLTATASAQASESAQQEETEPTTTPTATEAPKEQPDQSASASAPAAKTPATKALGFASNKFGIHLFAGPDQIELAAELVNSNGGDWGWATMTYLIDDRNSAWWNEIFAKCREKHIIPIVQLNNNGNIPTEAQIEGAAEFLAGLGWPTKIRVVSAFNEVNADEYWGGQSDPAGYARILDHFINVFKAKNSEFFVLNGPFNSSARKVCVHTDLGVDTCYISEDQFLLQMNQTVPGIFAKLDGWASHCYPHPAYRGHPLSTQDLRSTMSSYKWELGLLQSYFGVSLPVFITETGWPHQEGVTNHPEWHPAATVAEYYKTVYQDLWGPDSRVVAATPFILKYDQYDNFSFVRPDGSFFPQWEAIKSLPKTAGDPPI